MGTSAIVDPQLLIHRLAEARTQTDALFAIVRPEAYYDRPIPERHRIIFYMGHLEAFDWNLLGRRTFDLAPFAPAYDHLFSFGIDPIDGGLPTDTPDDWPRHSVLMRYNRTVRETLDRHLNKVDEQGARGAEIAQLLNVMIEHRLMHAETLSYMLHQLSIDRKFPQKGLAAPAAQSLGPRMVEIPAGVATLGLARTRDDGAHGVGLEYRREDGIENQRGEPFGWDNEFEKHLVNVPPFRIDVVNVTNGEFLCFLNAGAYQDRSLWSDSDWEWVQSCCISRPGFWVLRQTAAGDKWYYRGMFEELPLPLDWPAYVSHAEASAYARWVGKELPTEAEWHRAATGTQDGSEQSYPWGDGLPNLCHGNFNFDRWDPTPVGAFPAGTSSFGVHDLVGNGWEWTRTPFAPFKGFEPFPFYPGYSANFFDGKHYVMKGGSARTASCMLRRSFRNWFQPHYPFVYASFRCVQH